MLLCLAMGAAVGANARGAGEHSHAFPADVPGTADVGFAQGMIQHHEHAVTMSDIALQRGSERILMLANLIRSDQLQETGLMEGRPTAWNEPWLTESAPMAWVQVSATSDGGDSHGTSDDHGEHGVGAISCADLWMIPDRCRVWPPKRNLTDCELCTARRSTTTLLLMIRHHQGAIPTVDGALAAAKSRAVRDMAERIGLEQSTEIVDTDEQCPNLASGAVATR